MLRPFGQPLTLTNKGEYVILQSLHCHSFIIHCNKRLTIEQRCSTECIIHTNRMDLSFIPHLLDADKNAPGFLTKDNYFIILALCKRLRNSLCLRSINQALWGRYNARIDKRYRQKSRRLSLHRFPCPARSSPYQSCKKDLHSKFSQSNGLCPQSGGS